VILTIREQTQRLNLLSKAPELIDALGDAFRTDLPTDQWIGMGRFGSGLQRDAFHQYTLTDLLGETTINGIYYLTADWSQAVGRAADFSPKENRRALHAAAPERAVRVVAMAESRSDHEGRAMMLDALPLIALLSRRKPLSRKMPLGSMEDRRPVSRRRRVTDERSRMRRGCR